MALVRRLAIVALSLACLAVGIPPAGPPDRAGDPAAALQAISLAADVGWPPSSGVVVAEVVTGGASASDEWIELANVGSDRIDLALLEVVYVTSSGATITRKAAWPAGATIEPGARLLLANAAGIHAGSADITYSGGLSATGGTVVVRAIGGAPVDAVGWGDASNAFVEGSPAPAPSPGTSIARAPLPGGGLADTNDNMVDLAIDPAPIPEGSTSGGPSPAPSPAPSPSPTPTPTLEPSPQPSPTPEPSPQPSPTPAASPTPTPSQTPAPSPSPQPSPSPSADPGALSIGTARALPDGAVATIEGVLTTDLGALESGRGAFIQDLTAGIAVLMDAAVQSPVPAGHLVRVTGTLDDRYSQRTIRATALADLGADLLPEALVTPTGSAGEELEGRRLTVTGAITEGPDPLSDGEAVTVDDGSGPLRVVLASGLAAELALARGDRLVATGPLGQRDSSGTGLAGYRLHVTRLSDATRSAPESSPQPSASPSPWASPSAAPSIEPTPSADPRLMAIVDARALGAGAEVRIRGVVTAEPGRLAKPALVPVEDGTAGILVRLPDDVRIERGVRIDATGRLADPFGQLEVRVEDPGALVDLGPASEPMPLDITAADLGEPLEGRLVGIVGTLRGVERSTAGTLVLSFEDVDGVAFRTHVDPSTGIDQAGLPRGAVYRIVGVVGQRASRTGAADGYRVWLRDGEDLVMEAPPSSPSPNAGATPSPSATPPVIGIADAVAAGEGLVTVEGVVTAGPSLLDGTGRRIVIQDASAAVELLLPEAARWSVGDRIQVTGTMGTAYGAPRLRVSTIVGLGPTVPPAPLRVDGSLDERLEWRLARAEGTLVDVQRLGDRWRGDLRLTGGATIPLSGLAGAGIDVATLHEGAGLTVTGLVRRPYPTAIDRRFALVPRGPADLRADDGPASSSAVPGATKPGIGPLGRAADGAANGGARSTASAAAVDLATLSEHLGAVVRVSGLVVSVDEARVSLDDGTAVADLELRGPAAVIAADLRTGDAISARGRVEAGPTGPLVAVEDPAGIVLAGDVRSVAGRNTDDGPDAPSMAASPIDRPDSAAERIRLVAAGAAVLSGLLVGLLVAVARRRQDRRRWHARVLARLTAMTARRDPGLAQRTVTPDAGSGQGPVPNGATLGAERGGPA